MFATQHRVPSVGYILMHERKTGLKSEYQSLSREELKELGRSGVKLTAVEEIVEVVYSGDTLLDAVLAEPRALRSDKHSDPLFIFIHL